MAIDYSQLISALQNKFEKLSNKSNVITDSTQTGDDVKYTTINAVRSWVNSKLSGKQDTLVGSGTGQNIKTINNTSLLGTGNISISVEGGDYSSLNNKPKINNVELDGNKSLSDIGIQAAITDIEDIRDGAELGATAVQDSNYVHTDNNFTNTLKTKLDDIEAGANKTVVDSSMSSSSTNPVQNKVIKSALDLKASKDVVSTTADGLMSVADKEKLDGIEDGANAYELPTASNSVLGGVKVGTNLSISGAGVLSAVDTTYDDVTTTVHGLMTAADKSKLDSITVANIESVLNKKTSVTSSSTDTEYPSAKAVYTAITNAISGVTQFDYQVVQTLPESGVKGTIYLVPNTKGSQDLYDEYLWLTDKWEKIGTTAIDLSNYFTKTETNSAISSGISTHNTNASAHSTLFAAKLEESDLQDAFDNLADAIDDIE